MRELSALADATAPFAFNADGKKLVTQQGRGGIAVWDLSGAAPVKKSSGQLAQPRSQMLTMAIAPPGDRVATCYGDGAAGRFTLPGQPAGDVILWDLAADPPKPTATFGAFKNDPMFYMIRAAAFSKDGKTLAFASQPRTVELWDVEANPPKCRRVAGRDCPGGLSHSRLPARHWPASATACCFGTFRNPRPRC